MDNFFIENAIISKTNIFNLNFYNNNIISGAPNEFFRVLKPKCFNEYIFNLVVRQLSDESPKVVKNAVQILLNWLPVFFYFNI